MAGLDPAIHAFLFSQGVDARHKAGHEVDRALSNSLQQVLLLCIIVHLAGEMRMSVAADARAETPAPTAVGAIPRNYNFAADILERNLKAGRAGKPAFIDPRGTWTYGTLADRVARFAA